MSDPRLEEALALHRRGDLVAAEAIYDAVLRDFPGHPGALQLKGTVAFEMGRGAEAKQLLRAALERAPDSYVIHTNLSSALLRTGDISGALLHAKRAVELSPGHADAHNNLGSALLDTGEVVRAMDAYREALRLEPTAKTHSNLVYAANFIGDDPQDLLRLHTEWSEACARPLRHRQQPLFNTREPHRKLRIGYLSPDFREHSVAHFALPLLEHHDKSEYWVACYANVRRSDATTKRFQDVADAWIDITAMTDEQVAAKIRADKIDILVDLAGHTGNNRLPVFALKPSPVQVSWLGYPNTTGLSDIDWRVTDAYADPDGAERHHAEALWRMHGGFLCYEPPVWAPPITERQGAPGEIAFGSFNHLPKMSAAVMDSWARILERVPGATLTLKAVALLDQGVCDRVLQAYAARGIDPARIRILPFTVERQDHLRCYNAVDIALDPFPYNGTTTTCEALWMGVPVVTLAGQRHSARVGVSLLRQVGLEELIAEDLQQYEDLAVALAEAPETRAAFRGSLRDIVGTSSLCHWTKFVGEMEAAYRSMWKSFCAR